MTTIAHVLGARPNFVKMAPVFHGFASRRPDVRQVLVHTGQHYDREMSDVFLEQLGLPEPDHFLGVGSGGHGEQTGKALERLEAVFRDEQPDVVCVAGDVNSTLAGALAAVKLGIPVAHVESGLRSFDRTMPEEVNRVLVDQISTWCFTHSPEAHGNLLREGVAEERIRFVGNTMIDSLVRLEGRLEDSATARDLGLELGAYVLVTLHRPALVDGPLLEPALEALERLGRRVPVVFPLHPRTRARIAGRPDAAGVHFIPPLSYVDFLALERHAAAVLTDSGGVQEETTYLGVPCFTLRDSTERPVTLTHGTNRLLGLRVEGIDEVGALLGQAAPAAGPPPLWDGRAGQRLVDDLLADLELDALPTMEPAAGPSAA